jgi:hypothetical protein
MRPTVLAYFDGVAQITLNYETRIILMYTLFTTFGSEILKYMFCYKRWKRRVYSNVFRLFGMTRNIVIVCAWSWT